MAFHTKGVRRLQACTLQLIESPIMNHQGRNANMNFSEIRHDYIWGPAVENGANGGHDLLAAVSIVLGRAQTTMKRVRSSPMCF